MEAASIDLWSIWLRYLKSRTKCAIYFLIYFGTVNFSTVKIQNTKVIHIIIL